METRVRGATLGVSGRITRIAGVAPGRVGELIPGAAPPADVYGLELAGEEDAFAAREAESVGVGVRVVAPGLAVADAIDREAARRLAYTRSVVDLLGRTDADPRSARAVVTASDLRGVREGTVAVRARVVRDSAAVSASEAERLCGSALVERGFGVDLDDPDHVLRVLFAGDTCLVGWVVAESVRDFGARKPTDRPFFQPGSMAPMDARAYANIAGSGPGRRLLDPMCGTGGTLIEAGLAGSSVVGVDAQAKMVRGTRENLARYVPDADRAVVSGDATALPLRDDAVDGVVFDAPYGRQSKIARHDLSDLVAGALSEAARVAPRGVLVADRSWREAALESGWRVTDLFERRVHRSLVRHVHVLERA